MQIHQIIPSLIITAAIISGCADDKDKPVASTMLFEPCIDDPTLECGVFKVPLIHDSSDNRKINIDVARLRGTGDGPHETLLLNIGGPGSGTEILREYIQANYIPSSIRERYHIIGFDQRGVSNSLRVDCDQYGNSEPTTYPRDQSEILSLVNDSTMLADACSAEFSDQLQWVGSNAVVQDMEILRSKLKATKLNIIGSSFGTRITALYLERFPERSGRVILDAPLSTDGKINTLLFKTAVAQQRSFDIMLDACGTILPDCARTEVETAFVTRVNNLLNNKDLNTFNAFINLVSIAIEETETGKLLAPLLIDYAINGDPTDMFTIIDEYGLESDENERLSLEKAVVCADDATRPSVETLLTKLMTLNETSDFFAEAILPTAANCAGWPEAINPMTDIRTSDAPTSLVIGGTGDVRTPISWALETADAINGVFIMSEHQGHTTVFTRDNNCIDSIVVDFLLEGELPLNNTICN